MKKYLQFLNEAAPRVPKKLDYWLKKGKKGKECRIYTHNDLDGIFSAIEMKKYLLNNGFTINGYGIIDYQEGWNAFILDKSYINIALDYAENVDGVDVYVDHHAGGEDDLGIGQYAIKGKTGSAYELICLSLGLSSDDTVLSVIDMIDSAKYKEYHIDIEKILDFEISDFKNKLEFAASFNQMIKRGDYRTLIEVIHNSKDVSIYAIYDLFKKLYPANNIPKRGVGKGEEQDFIESGKNRIGSMISRTRGSLGGSKIFITDQNEFYNAFDEKVTKKVENPETGLMEEKELHKITMDGYQILGQLIYVPAGTWANALRARAIIERDLKSKNIPNIEFKIIGELKEELKEFKDQKVEVLGNIFPKAEPEDDYQELEVIKILTEEELEGPATYEGVTYPNGIEGIKGYVVSRGGNVYLEAKQPLFWVMLQYGSSLQVATFRELDRYVKKYLPKVDGRTIDNLGKYCTNLLNEFGLKIAYKNEDTKSGGHLGIGNVSNISYKKVTGGKYDGVKYMDLFKNKMIQDLSGIPWPNLGMIWSEMPPTKSTKKVVDEKFLTLDKIRTL